LIPLLSPYVQSPVAIDLYAEGGPLMNKSPMKFAKCPEYFSNFKRHGGDWAVYLGACIMGKVSYLYLYPPFFSVFFLNGTDGNETFLIV
jgi:hypothetical protein